MRSAFSSFVIESFDIKQIYFFYKKLVSDLKFTQIDVWRRHVYGSIQQTKPEKDSKWIQNSHVQYCSEIFGDCIQVECVDNSKEKEEKNGFSLISLFMAHKLSNRFFSLYTCTTRWSRWRRKTSNIYSMVNKSIIHVKSVYPTLIYDDEKSKWCRITKIQNRWHQDQPLQNDNVKWHNIQWKWLRWWFSIIFNLEYFTSFFFLSHK